MYLKNKNKYKIPKDMHAMNFYKDNYSKDRIKGKQTNVN